MDVLFANPKLVIAAALVVLLVIAANWALVLAAKGDPTATERAAKWGKALRGNADAQKKQQSDLDELHRRVVELKNQDDSHG